MLVGDGDFGGESGEQALIFGGQRPSAQDQGEFVANRNLGVAVLGTQAWIVADAGYAGPGAPQPARGAGMDSAAAGWCVADLP